MKATKMRVARAAECLGQMELSKIVGVSKPTIVKAEKGEVDNIKFGTLKAIASALNSTVEELFLSVDDN